MGFGQAFGNSLSHILAALLLQQADSEELSYHNIWKIKLQLERDHKSLGCYILMNIKTSN